MELLLQNATFAKLEKSDLKRIKDKNLIKLFKLGQLTTEYLLYTHVRYDFFVISMCRNTLKDTAKATSENTKATIRQHLRQKKVLKLTNSGLMISKTSFEPKSIPLEHTKSWFRPHLRPWKTQKSSVASSASSFSPPPTIWPPITKSATVHSTPKSCKTRKTACSSATCLTPRSSTRMNS